MKPRGKLLSQRLGSALVMTLVIIVLITVVTVGYLASVMLETKTAGSSLDQERAYGIAMVGAHQAMAKIREALGPWDDPYKNFAASNPPFYWSLSPGRITRWSYASVSPQMNIGLFSESPGTNLVNLNRQLIDGSYPIIGGSNAPEISVKWANLLRDPTQPAGANNAIAGRYAFWVDDEGAKINVNTADGTEKYTTNSLGIGTPSEVSLGVLLGTNTNGPAKQVVRMARTNGFTSPREILRVSGVTNTAFADNVFSLTAHSRSPELNVFGEPRLSVAPILGNDGFNSSNMVLNSLTLLPPREFYPTPAQLRPYVIRSRYDIDPGASRNHPWPLALRGELGVYPTGVNLFHPYAYALREGPKVPNYSYNQGFLLANYLAGINDVGRSLTWPVFPGSSTGGFAGKYSLRQLDSLVAQILSIGSKAISSDYPNISGTPNGVGEQIGHRFMVVPYLFPGWLSGKWVNGIGRSPKVTQMYMEIAGFASPTPTNSPQDPSYEPPFATLDIWVEWWLPVGYFGGRKELNFLGSEFYVGQRSMKSTLNVVDMPRAPGEPSTPNRFAAPFPRQPDGNSPEIDGFWADQLLRNNQGIDLAGNPGIIQGNPNPREDNSQTLAQKFHDPYARFDLANAAGPWRGDGRAPPFLPSGVFKDYASPFFMTHLEPNASPADEWQPGEMRVIRSILGNAETGLSPYRYSMQTSVSTNSTLVIEGGIAVKTQMKGGFLSDPDPVPLEAIRGPYDVDGVTTEEPYTNFQGNRSEAQIDAEWETDTPGEGTLRERVLASVIPVSANVVVGGPGQVVAAAVEDPLVNKFPGDWIISSSSTISPSVNKYYDIDSMSGNFRGRLADPDSYWMPQADAGLCTSIADVAAQTQIPRSARMPNVGYLQYVRTGIIPDDETVAYAAQRGTPFRLLSYAPSTETSSQRTINSASVPYPDWALLDLFYIPSTLASFGSTYNPASATPGTNSAVTNLLYYGTYGGATAGKVNPNGAVIYTTNADVAQANVSRRLPIESVLSGVWINQTITGVSTNATFTNGSAVDASAIAQAIEKYIRANAPLRMPAEICNVPEIADLRATNNPTRNDLVRQIVGTLTTQGNVFSVWTVGQAINKKPANTQYDEFEPGDNVLAEVRLRFIIERYLDPGSDNVYGNSANPGADGVVGTYDDPVDPDSHPFEPRYLYRVLASEELR
jgi:hypothetical protein